MKIKKPVTATTHIYGGSRFDAFFNTTEQLFDYHTIIENKFEKVYPPVFSV